MVRRRCRSESAVRLGVLAAVVVAFVVDKLRVRDGTESLVDDGLRGLCYEGGRSTCEGGQTEETGRGLDEGNGKG